MKLQFTYNQYFKSNVAIVILSVIVGCNLLQDSQQKNDIGAPAIQNPPDSNSGSGNGSGQNSGSNPGNSPDDNPGGAPGQNPNPGDGSSGGGGGQIDFIF